MDDQLTLYYDELSKSHFWLTSKTYVIEQFLAPVLNNAPKHRRILEVGCCAGNFLKRFTDSYDEVHGLDLSMSALQRCRDQNPNIHSIRANGLRLPYEDGAFDLILMQDVIEHIPEDEATMRELRRVMADDGHCFICVPAYMFLYGHHDKLFGHVRRYTRKELREKLARNGFSVGRATYFQSPFLLPLYVKRRFGGSEGDDFLVPPKPINAFFDRLLRLEALPMRLMNIPFGPTLMCLATKAPLPAEVDIPQAEPAAV